MSLVVTCQSPDCGKKFRVQEGQSGKKFRCAACGKISVIAAETPLAQAEEPLVEVMAGAPPASPRRQAPPPKAEEPLVEVMAGEPPPPHRLRAILLADDRDLDIGRLSRHDPDRPEKLPPFTSTRFFWGLAIAAGAMTGVPIVLVILSAIISLVGGPGAPAHARGGVALPLPAESENPGDPPETVKPPTREPISPTKLAGLVAYFAMDEGQGTRLRDSSGNDLRGILRGGWWVRGVRGNAIYLDGKENCLDLGDDPKLSFRNRQPFTIACWVQTKKSGVVFACRSKESINPVIHFEAGGAVHAFVRDDETALGEARVGVGPAFNDGEWHHVAMARDANGTVSVYRDGAFGDKRKGRSSTGAITTTFRAVGRDLCTLHGPPPPYEGAVDEFCIFDRVLSDEEIEALAGVPKKQEPISPMKLEGLLVYLPMDEGEGSQLKDQSPSQMHAQARGGGAWVAGVRGNAFQLNSKQYIDLGDHSALNFKAGQEFSIACWVKTKSVGTFVAFRHKDSAAPIIHMEAGGNVRVILRADGVEAFNVEAGGGDRVNDAQWHHVVLVREADGSVSVFRDGAFVQKEKSPKSGGPITTDLRALGRDLRPGPGPPRFEGAVDEFCIFGRVLHPQEIAALAGLPVDLAAIPPPKKQEKTAKNEEPAKNQETAKNQEPVKKQETAKQDLPKKQEPASPQKLGGLLAYFPMDEGEGAGLLDQSGNRLRAVGRGGGDWVPGIKGKAIYLDGKESFVYLDNSPVLNFKAGQAFSIAVWVKTKKGGTVLGWRHKDNGAPMIFLSVGGDIQAIVRADGPESGEARVGVGQGVNDGEWHHLVLGRDTDGTVAIYRDGVFVAKKKGDNSTAAITTDLRGLGRELRPGQSAGTPYEGALDELCIFDRLLRPDEVAALAGWSAVPPEKK